MHEQERSAQLQQLQQHIEQYGVLLDRLLAELGKVIVGQQPLLRKIMIGLLCKGHLLLEGVPGLAKTLTVQTLAQCLSLDFQRIQFTPDLLPADLIGTQIYNPQNQSFSPKFGPVFAHVILADEINRAPAKVQAALLESMQEKQVTIGEQSYALPQPFLVMATQNPIDQEGTYPLPEAQLDRFMLKLLVAYPSRAEEMEIMERMIERPSAQVSAVLPREHLLALQGLVPQIHLAAPLKEYILDIVLSTREPVSFGHVCQTSRGELSLGQFIEQGASPRATLALNLASRAHALLHRRAYVTPDDIKAVTKDVLRHRIILSYEAEAESFNEDRVLQSILDQLDLP